MEEEKAYWVALSRHKRIGARTFKKLYARFKDLRKVWKATDKDLSLTGLDLGQIEAIKEIKEKVKPEKEYEKVQRMGIKVLTLADKEYPELLKEIPDPPGILYIKGELRPQDELALAVVGSRKYTPYGKRVTEELVSRLVHHKLTIISGLALGIDSVAHEVAVTSEGRTLAVLACGLDQIYPITNIRLADKILKSDGAILSEFPLGMPALRHNFPIRNRIIAGLALGTLVIECAEGSGSLLTSAAAIEYNREVFAVPGEIFSETAVGTNKLIKMGAKIVTSYKDILDELNIEDREKEGIARDILPENKEEEILLKILKTPQTIDYLVRSSKLETRLVNGLLIQMEMKGKVKNLGSTRYVINGRLS